MPASRFGEPINGTGQAHSTFLHIAYSHRRQTLIESNDRALAIEAIPRLTGLIPPTREPELSRPFVLLQEFPIELRNHRINFLSIPTNPGDGHL